MAHPKPLEYGGTYHITNGGVGRGTLFFEERNTQHFIWLYGRVRPALPAAVRPQPGHG